MPLSSRRTTEQCERVRGLLRYDGVPEAAQRVGATVKDVGRPPFRVAHHPLDERRAQSSPVINGCGCGATEDVFPPFNGGRVRAEIVVRRSGAPVPWFPTPFPSDVVGVSSNCTAIASGIPAPLPLIPFAFTCSIRASHVSACSPSFGSDALGVGSSRAQSVSVVPV